QCGPPREPPRVRRDEGPGHARRALDRDAPGLREVLEQCFMDGPNPVRPSFSIIAWRETALSTRDDLHGLTQTRRRIIQNLAEVGCKPCTDKFSEAGIARTLELRPGPAYWNGIQQPSDASFLQPNHFLSRFERSQMLLGDLLDLRRR